MISDAAITSPTDSGGAVGRTTSDTKRARIGSPTYCRISGATGVEVACAATGRTADISVGTIQRL
jgi:hypothetical protein